MVNIVVKFSLMIKYNRNFNANNFQQHITNTKVFCPGLTFLKMVILLLNVISIKNDFDKFCFDVITMYCCIAVMF